MKVTFLGTGTSHGVPSIDCMARNFEHCRKGVCRESFTDPKHNRTRCSILVEKNGRRILIDVSADFRQQALREQIPEIDAVLITHSHSDHIAGIPDIRSYTRDRALPLYGAPTTLAQIEKSFSYIFNPPENPGGGIPQLDLITVTETFEIFGVKVVPLAVEHGSLLECYGYRIGGLAYIPDFKVISGEAMKSLAGVRSLILDCLRDERPHSTHVILPESVAIAREIAPSECYFTHLCHDIHYIQDADRLDTWMSFAYDGQTIEVSEE